MILEIVSSSEEFPSDINPDHHTYSILYINQLKRLIGTTFGFLLLLAFFLV